MKARIQVFCGGKYGRSGEYIAEIIPKYFKNGNIKKTVFTWVKTIEITKKWYAYGNARVTERIKEIIEE